MKPLYYLFALPLLLLASCSNQTNTKFNIPFEKYTLKNGLDVILNEDHSDPIVALNIVYHVGSNRETDGRTGFAHLFEHIMFQRSENVPEDQFSKIVKDAGGTMNGGTSNDFTIYYEVVPKNALEKVLWLESDRMGFLENAITQKSFSIQQNVVQNEKRQRCDNVPYGHTEEVIARNFFPTGHPYSWTVIGEMQDLSKATLEEVEAFLARFYIPNNATLALSGDFDPATAKRLIEKYFGEIKRGAAIEDPNPEPIKLTETKKVYFEDNFANAPALNIVWPTVDQQIRDRYALDYLGQLLSESKKAPLYKVLVKDKKLTSYAYAYNNSQEIAGRFQVRVTANEGASLKEVESAIFEAFARFEKEGFTEADVERIKASLETDYYNEISTVLGKSSKLSFLNEYYGSPNFYKKSIERSKAVTKADIIRVYEKYIKGKPYVAVSCVPKGQLSLAAEGSINAGVKEEEIQNAAQVKIDENAPEESVIKTPSAFDRSIMPVDGPDPDINLPILWEDKLANGMKIFGIEQNELPLVNFDITMKGGQYLETPEKAGVASLMAQLMNKGTQNKTPLELEEAIEMLGADISVSASNTFVSISGNCLVRNFDTTMALLEEMLLEPRWDEEEFVLAKIEVLNNLKQQKVSPTTLANETLQKLIFGDDHIFSISPSGTEESIGALKIDDLKTFYKKTLSPSVANFHIAGQISKEKVMTSLQLLTTKWQAKEVAMPTYTLPETPVKSQIYFIDVPGAKQSIIRIGCPSLLKTNPDYVAATFMNENLGRLGRGWFSKVLRQEKGFTYSAYSVFTGTYAAGSFTASSSVRSSATLESLQIFKALMTKYRDGITQEELDFTKSSVLKSYALNYETLDQLSVMLGEISMYNLPKDYSRIYQATIRNMTLEQHKALAQKYIDPNRMYY
ncbi:MAG: pitrilysin family protein, partial [Bacteroidales bacterium]